MSDYQDDTEISLGAGKLLFLFFGLVILCGGFFGVGYMIGKNSGPPQVAASTAEPTTAATGSAKPSSAVGRDAAPADTQPFYDSVGQKSVSPKLEPAAAAPAPAVPEQKTPAPPEVAKPATSTAPGTGYVVQVAAVSKQQDADTLVNALRKKQYPVFVTSNPPNDKLFHVQAGPFADVKEAEAVKARLINDGYSPILKR